MEPRNQVVIIDDDSGCADMFESIVAHFSHTTKIVKLSQAQPALQYIATNRESIYMVICDGELFDPTFASGNICDTLPEGCVITSSSKESGIPFVLMATGMDPYSLERHQENGTIMEGVECFQKVESTKIITRIRTILTSQTALNNIGC